MLRTYLVYNTVVRLCQVFCCGGKVNFVRIPYSHDRFSKILRFFFLNWSPIKPTYKKTTSFLRCMENSVWFPKQYLLGFFILDKQLANIPDRGFLFLHNTLLLHSLSPYWQTERLTEKWINPGCAGLPDGSSRLILVGLGNLWFLQVNPGWAG